LVWQTGWTTRPSLLAITSRRFPRRRSGRTIGLLLDAQEQALSEAIHAAFDLD